ncbi:uncharacterized protein LOC130725121 [Lotus japonicus]|uniref:uncharacterized protein LOC130725121 n=1 Tax=Lotus japonicus TaxID=34305 RepID=UPI0025902654|nr:uncharacterized protein LOC130725121 [Lotus japonicus]
MGGMFYIAGADRAILEILNKDNDAQVKESVDELRRLMKQKKSKSLHIRFLKLKTTIILIPKQDLQYFQDREILTPSLEAVEMINTYMLGMVAASEHENLSSDSALRSDEDSEIRGEWFTIEFLNSTKSSGISNHKLLLKVGTPITLLRYMDQAEVYAMEPG